MEESLTGHKLTTQSTRRRLAVSAEADVAKKDLDCSKVIPKSSDARARIEKILQKNIFLKSLDKEQIHTVTDAVQEVKYKEGDVIIKQGDEGDMFYLLEDGDCEVWIKEKDKTQSAMVKQYTGGDSFGELALLYNSPRAATIKAKTSCTIWAMDRATFRGILMSTTNERRQLYEKFLAEVPLLKSLSSYERAVIADVLVPEYFEPGNKIIVEGEPGETFYFLVEGEAEATSTGKPSKKYQRGDYFGELALLSNQPRAATITALTQCKCVSIDRESFKRMLGKVENILNRQKTQYASAGSSS